MGRLQPATRASFENYLRVLRAEYRDLLRSEERREAFDSLVGSWSDDLGAFTYAESISLLDLILLSGEVDNRARIEALRIRLDVLADRQGENESSRPCARGRSIEAGSKIS